MKSLLKLALVTLGLAAAAIPSVNAANADATARERHPRMLKHRAMVQKHAARRLELSKEQRTQLRAERDKTRDALKALRNDATLSRTEKRDKARELLQSSRTHFRDALTPEQKAKIDQFRANREAKRKARN